MSLTIFAAFLTLMVLNLNRPVSDCPTDLNNDRKTDNADLMILLGAIGNECKCNMCKCPTDLNGDNVTDTCDLQLLKKVMDTKCN